MSAAAIQRAVALFDPIWDLLLVSKYRAPEEGDQSVRPKSCQYVRQGRDWCMPRLRTPIQITLSGDERMELERRARALTASHRSVVRAKVILLLSVGETVSDVARTVGYRRRIVRKWAWRFVEKRLEGLEDLPRSGCPARFSPSGSRSSNQVGVRAARPGRAFAIAVDVR